MIFLFFILSAIITVFSAKKLSDFADTLSVKTPISGMLIGTILLAGATSLPEVTTSFSAIFINNPDIAVGNVFGSNLFNLFILAIVDLYYRDRQMLAGARREHLYTAFIGLLLAIISLTSLIVKVNITFLSIGLDSLLLIITYILGMVIISRATKVPELEIKNKKRVVEEQSNDDTTVKKAIIGFFISAIVILITGTTLSITGDKIATITGLSSSFVGSFLIAATTSLPEAVAVLSAVHLRNYNLAIGAILGSNMFNMLIISGADLIYTKGSLFADASPVHNITASAVVILSLITLYPLLRKTKKSGLRYSIPSLLLIIVYFISSYLIFIK